MDVDEDSSPPVTRKRLRRPPSRYRDPEESDDVVEVPPPVTPKRTGPRRRSASSTVQSRPRPHAETTDDDRDELDLIGEMSPTHHPSATPARQLRTRKPPPLTRIQTQTRPKAPSPIPSGDEPRLSYPAETVSDKTRDSEQRVESDDDAEVEKAVLTEPSDVQMEVDEEEDKKVEVEPPTSQPDGETVVSAPPDATPQAEDILAQKEIPQEDTVPQAETSSTAGEEQVTVQVPSESLVVPPVVPPVLGPTDVRAESNLVYPVDASSAVPALVPESQTTVMDVDPATNAPLPGSDDSIEHIEGPTIAELAARPPEMPDAPAEPLTIDPALLQAATPTKYRGLPPLVRETFNVDYTLPPLKALPAEYHRKAKSKSKAKKGKEKAGSKDDWAPAGLNNWIASMRTLPIAKKVARATKCLSTRDWNVCII